MGSCKPSGMFTRLNRPIHFDSVDGNPVDFVFLLLIPPAAAGARVLRLQEGGSFGALRLLGLVGFVIREDELNDWGELVGVVLVVLAQENNFIVELAGAWRCAAAAGAGAEGGGAWP
jgi:hypothetical protein